jgi:hypothetical protein
MTSFTYLNTLWMVAANIAYSISSHGQSTRGGPPSKGLGRVLTIHHRQRRNVTQFVKVRCEGADRFIWFRVGPSGGLLVKAVVNLRVP